MFLQQAAHDVAGMKDGALYFLRGIGYLWRNKSLWPLLVVPILLNALLFILFVWGALILLRRFFFAAPPETWWAWILLGAALVATLGAIVFFGSFLLVFVGSVVAAPFYDRLAQRTARAEGGIIIERPFWQEVWRPIKHALVKFWWYILVQAGLLVLFIMPFAVGPVAYATLGFLATAYFLALEFLDFSFDFRGLTFTERWKWCMERKGVVLGFGAATFAALLVPGANLLVPPVAVVSSILLFEAYDQSHLQRKSGEGGGDGHAAGMPDG